MPERVIQCTECGRVWRGEDDWNATMKQGVAMGVLCSSCQTPEQNIEAEINAATVDYGYATDARGNQRVVGRPKK